MGNGIVKQQQPNDKNIVKSDQNVHQKKRKTTWPGCFLSPPAHLNRNEENRVKLLRPRSESVKVNRISGHKKSCSLERLAYFGLQKTMDHIAILELKEDDPNSVQDVKEPTKDKSVEDREMQKHQK